MVRGTLTCMPVSLSCVHAPRSAAHCRSTRRVPPRPKRSISGVSVSTASSAPPTRPACVPRAATSANGPASSAAPHATTTDDDGDDGRAAAAAYTAHGRSRHTATVRPADAAVCASTCSHSVRAGRPSVSATTASPAHRTATSSASPITGREPPLTVPTKPKNMAAWRTLLAAVVGVAVCLGVVAATTQPVRVEVQTPWPAAPLLLEAR
jgi:hypothetical protein